MPCAATVIDLPDQPRVLERGWPSSSNILLIECGHPTLMDSGYIARAARTIAPARHALKAVFTFWLLERGRAAAAEPPKFLAGVFLYRELNARFFRRSCAELADWLIRDLGRAGAVRCDGYQTVAADVV
jgi:hypothetical protein